MPGLKRALLIQSKKTAVSGQCSVRKNKDRGCVSLPYQALKSYCARSDNGPACSKDYKTGRASAKIFARSAIFLLK